MIGIVEERLNFWDSVMSSRCDEAVEEFPLSCWENMPAELLRDVMMRIEESESTWRRRSIVVACAGVCRSWRVIVRQIVGTLQLSGKLTFPISLKQVYIYYCTTAYFVDLACPNDSYKCDILSSASYYGV